ncbi:MAG: meromycolic acid enoyl-[acyl-carrier-protein] reductase [Verrucomicrobiota bacterium]|nr:meromycolic acid enoyl-[acyl-carrier-protein] reductase [Verrucomicrobiota bacterium]
MVWHCPASRAYQPAFRKDAKMIKKGGTYVVMGLLNTDSIAYAAGKMIESFGGQVIYTVQNERLKKIFFDRGCTDLSQEEKDAMDIRYCDVTVENEVRNLFKDIGEINGVVHSIGFANPKTCLGDKVYTNHFDDIKQGFHISCASLATVAEFAQEHMSKGGSIVTLSFASQLAFPYYNWMGVNKAALEALVRALAREYGREHVRVNAISAGPLATKAAKSIPHFAHLARTWKKISPLPWDVIRDKQEVANAVVFLLGEYSKKITGQTIYVDGGASSVGGELLPHERPIKTMPAKRKAEAKARLARMRALQKNKSG